MKRILSAAMVATLFAGAALAQPPERGDRGDRGGGQRGDGGQRQGGGDGGNRGGGDRQQSQPQQAQPQPAQAAPQAQQAPQGVQPGRGSYLRTPGAQGDAARRGDDPRNGFQGRPDNGQRGSDNRGPDNRGDNRGPDNRGGDNRGFDNRGPGGFDNRGPGRDGRDFRGGGQQQFRDRDRGRPQFSQRNFRPSYRAPQRFRAGQYRAPQGFYNRSWSFGDRLPYGWFGSSYYLNWNSYGLPLPPIGCEWVRVGSDALLVDVWSGEVLSVYYGLFW